MSGPDAGAFGAIDAGAVPAVGAFEVADPAFAAGSPFDGAAEGFSMLDGALRLGRSAFAGDHHVGDTEVGELAVDAPAQTRRLKCQTRPDFSGRSS